MRKYFIQNLIEHNQKSKNKAYLLIGDIGFSVVEKFENLFPDNFVNVGVAEQNMSSLASGIASEGNLVFTYTIGNFATFRCAEQIRNTIDYHNYNVTIVATGSGVEYGYYGYSHHLLQDLGLMQLFPNFALLTPSDNQELKDCLNFCYKNAGPKYLRLSKFDYPNKIKSKINSSINLIVDSKKNKKTCFLTTGKISNDIYQNKIFKNYSLYSIPIWGNKKSKYIFNFLKNFDKIYTVEDHMIDCGFGNYIQNCCNHYNHNIEIKKIGFSNKIIGKVGNEKQLQNEIFKNLSKI